MAEDIAATSESWKSEPFGALCPIPYRRAFTSTELAQLLKGLIPEAMEDKWFVYFENSALYFHRSWTGQPVFRVDLHCSKDGAIVTEAWQAAELNQEIGYSVRLLDFLIANLLLGERKSFPTLPDLLPAQQAIFQHHISGTGYVSDRVTPQPVRRWWKLWQ